MVLGLDVKGHDKGCRRSFEVSQGTFLGVCFEGVGGEFGRVSEGFILRIYVKLRRVSKFVGFIF
jgi:hypothetical protein